MTRSDLAIEVALYQNATARQEALALADTMIPAMHRKIEMAYKIVFALEEDKNFNEIGKLLRTALES
jgi:hypothetical protein